MSAAPDATARLLEYGRSLYELRRYPEAEAQLRKYLARDPQSWAGHYYLGAAMLAQAGAKPEKIKDGLKEAQRTIALRPEGELGFLFALLGAAGQPQTG